jgi:hypothetical protein
VIALPGANQQGMDKLAALAKAAGQARVLAPTSEQALRSVLQSAVLGSLDSCTLQLNPAVTRPSDAHVIVGVQGVEQDMPRMTEAGDQLWTISDDGKQLTLQGKLCSALKNGDYDSLRVLVGCDMFERATAP